MRTKISAGQEKAGRTTELSAQLREAAKAGDTAKVEELREQIKNIRGGGGAAINELYERMDPILTDEQRTKLGELKEGRKPPMTRKSGSANAFARLKSQLNLTPDQEAEFDRLADEYDHRRRGGVEADPETNQLVDEMREAALAGDMKKVEELREKLRPRVDVESAAMNEFVEGLEPFLNEEQQEILYEHRSKVSAGRGQADARTLLRLTKRVEHLTNDQKEAIKKLERETRDGMRAARRDPAAMSQLDRDIQAKVRETLNAEQNAELDRLLNDEARGVVRRGRTAEDSKAKAERPGKKKARQGAEGKEGAQGSGGEPAPEGEENP